MRVLVVTPSRFFTSYGHPVRVLGEVMALTRVGVRVTICAYGHGADIPGFRIQRVRWTPERLKPGWSLARLFLDPLLGIAAAREVLHQRYDIIHAHIYDGTAVALLAKVIARVPLVADLQDSVSEILDGSGRWALARAARVMERFVTATADHVLTSSNQLASLLAERFGLSSDRVTTLLDAVDTGLYHPGRWRSDRTPVRVALGIPWDRFVIAYAGSLTARQGMDTLLALIRRSESERRGWHFLVLGAGETRYEAAFGSLAGKGHVTYVGATDYIRQTPRLLAAADVGISPKLPTTESNGKLLDYMAMELPVVASDTSANRELLGEFGTYVVGGSIDEWDRAILALSRNSAGRMAIGKRLRQRVIAQFSWTVRVNALLEIYSRVAKLPFRFRYKEITT